MSIGTINTINKRYSYLIAVILLAAGMTRILWGLLNCVDVPFGDDSMYLFFSRAFPGTILPDYGPLYVAGYKFFSLITHDALVAYRMGMFAHVMFPTVALFVAGLSFRLPPVLAAIVAIGFMANPFILDYGFFNPMVSHPAIAWIFLWAAWAWRRPVFTQLWSALLLTLVVVYYRPEHILTMLMIAGIAALWLLVKWRQRLNWKRVGLLLAVLVLIAGTFKIIGKPVGNSGKRSGLAFIQHVAITYLESKGDPHPWENHVYFSDYLPEMLGVNSSLDNLPSNPGELFKNSKPLLITHLKYNIIGFTENWLKTSSLLLPPGTSGWVAYLVSVLVILTTLWVLLRNRAMLREWWRIFTHHYGILWLIFLCFAITSKAVSIFIYPRVHYFLFSFPLFYLTAFLLVKWLQKVWGNDLKLIQASLPLVAIAYIILAPNVCSKAFMKVGGPDRSSTHIPAIETLWKMNISDSVRLLDREMGLVLYMPENYRYIDFNMDKPFMQYVQDKKVNMIHVTPTLLNDRHYKDDPEFGFFRKNLPLLGWQSITVPGTENEIWVKEDIAPPTR